MYATTPRTRFAAMVVEFIRTARIMKPTHAQIHGQFMSGIYATMSAKSESGRARYTAADRAYVQGAFDVLLNQLWQEVEFVYRDAAGNIYGTHRDSIYPYWQDAGLDGAAVNSMESAHLWKGTDKVFTEWSKAKFKEE